MKNKIITTSIVAVISVVMHSAMAADSGTITFTGTMSSGTCLTLPSDLNQTVQLGDFMSDAVVAAASGALLSDAKKVDFHVSDCPPAKTTADVKVTYTAVGATPIVANTGTARGVLIAPLKVNKTAGEVPQSSDTLMTGQKSNIASLASGAATVSFWVGAQKDSNVTPVAGTLAGTIAISMEYN